MVKWSETEVTQRLNIRYPIIQGPFGGGSTATLVATVSNAGGLGSFGACDLSPERIIRVAEDIRALTDKPFGLNLWVSTADPEGGTVDEETYERSVKLLAPYYDELRIEIPPRPLMVPHNFDDQVAALIEAGPAVFSFVFGIPSKQILRTCRHHKIVTAGVATTVDEAIALENEGVNVIVASGFEAGGHRPSFLKPAAESLIGNFALIPQVVDEVRVPVVAAGGIADGRGIAAALTLGAQGVQIGTAFLACEESGANPMHRKLLFEEEAKYTMLSRVYTGRLARSLSNRFGKDLQVHEPELAKYPAQSWIVAPLKAAAIAQGRSDLVSLWAGQAASLLRHRKPDDLIAGLRNARDLFATLVRETDKIFGLRSE
jgi:nitronate monooxygenase